MCFSNENVRYFLFIFNATLALKTTEGSKGTGPIFIVEPPTKVSFLNSYGTTLDCIVHGEPTPNIEWVNKERETVREIPGLLKIHENNSLALSKFENGRYRQDIHATVYRCRARNKCGTIISRKVQVTAVVDQQYSTQVYDEYVIDGNTAVFKCHVPSYVKDYITVSAWIKDDGFRISADDQYRKYVIMGDGDLHIVHTKMDDSNSLYKCQTRHTVSKEVKVTEVGGKLHITTPSSGISPKIVESVPEVKIISGQTVTLPCVAQGYPAPTYRWCFRKTRSDNCITIPNKLEHEVKGGSLIIIPTNHHDGFYTCKSSNEMGEAEAETKLTVHAPLSVFIHPERQMVDFGQFASLSCVVTGGPLLSVKWFKNGNFLKNDLAPLKSTVSVLNITSVGKQTEGMYQCFVKNSLDEKQAIGQIILSALPPTIIKKFSRKQRHPGQKITMECSATGDPLPEIHWMIRDSRIKRRNGIDIDVRLYKDQIFSKLTISRLETNDGGYYSCIALNNVGATKYTEALDVHGLPVVWPLQNQTVVEGNSVSIQCHISGYPIRSIKWNKDGQNMKEDGRIKIYPNGTLKILSSSANLDKGLYECIAENNQFKAHGRGTLRVIVQPTIEKLADKTLSTDQRLGLHCHLLTGDPPIEFSWLFNGEALPYHLGLVVADSAYLSGLSSPSVKRKHAGNYTCTAKNEAGFTSTHSMIKVKASPEWKLKPNSTEINMGQSIYMHCSGVGFPQPKTKWVKMKKNRSSQIKTDSERIRIFENGTLLISDIQKEDVQWTYQCIVSNGIPPELITDIKLKQQNEKIEFHVLPNTVQAEITKTIEMQCQAIGMGPFKLQWLFKEMVVTNVLDPRVSIVINQDLGFVQSTLRITDSSASDSGLYTCRVQNDKVLNSTKIYVRITDKSNLEEVDDSFWMSTITPLDNHRHNDTDSFIHLQGMAVLYIIPTLTAAIILVVLLIIVCVLLQKQRQKRETYKKQDYCMRNTLQHSKATDEDRFSEFYKAASDSSSNKYYEIKPHGNAYFGTTCSQTTTYKPGQFEIQPYATFTSGSQATDSLKKPSLEMKRFQ